MHSKRGGGREKEKEENREKWVRERKKNKKPRVMKENMSNRSKNMHQ